jgi:hypothetical protein
MNLIKPFSWTLITGRSNASNTISISADNSHFIDFTVYILNQLILCMESIIHQAQGDVGQRKLVGPADFALKAHHEFKLKFTTSPVPSTVRLWLEATFQNYHAANLSLLQGPLASLSVCGLCLQLMVAIATMLVS